MNAAKMKKCMDSGKTRAQCEKQVYPDGMPSKSSKKSSTKKKPPAFGGY
jgi:hypothetical protein